ncbi:MAG: substrate-binding domain-containing protein, partial [Sphingomicrobium sp.]
DFDAVFAASDLAAIGVMHALHALGRTVPTDVSIVGFDDIPAAALSSPRLTTVSQNPRQASEALIDAILALIEGGAPKNCLLPAHLIVRESSIAST